MAINRNICKRRFINTTIMSVQSSSEHVFVSFFVRNPLVWCERYFVNRQPFFAKIVNYLQILNIQPLAGLHWHEHLNLNKNIHEGKLLILFISSPIKSKQMFNFLNFYSPKFESKPEPFINYLKPWHNYSPIKILINYMCYSFD